MESERDRRFDPTSAGQTLLAIEHELSLSGLFDKLVARAVARSDIAFVRILLIETDALLYAAGAGGRGPHRTVSPPPGAGEGPIGGVAATGKRFGLRAGDTGWRELADAAWAENEGIRAFGAIPITFKGEMLGVISAFLRHEMMEEWLPRGQMLGRSVGAAVANARAFEKIRQLKDKLEERNACLEKEVVQAKAFGELAGESGARRQITGQIDLVAPTEASVLIFDETGTGKERVARQMHRRSKRAGGPRCA